jgi:Na+/proline symporter
MLKTLLLIVKVAVLVVALLALLLALLPELKRARLAFSY